MVKGKNLIQLGYKQGKWFKEALDYINKNNVEGEVVRNYLDSLQPVPMLPLHESSIPFYENISAENDIEEKNVQLVRKTMLTLMRTPTVVRGAIMPDACVAGPMGSIPVGGVVVTKKAIHPGMHSADICCSVMLTNFGKVSPKKILDAAHQSTHFGPGGRDGKDQYKLSSEILDKFKSNRYLNHQKSLQLAHSHLGTQGDGNHFLYVGTLKKTGDTVVVTHHGSRGVGAVLYNMGMKIAETFRKNISKDTPHFNAWIPSDTKEGETYWEALQFIRDWTKENHTVIHKNIARVLDIDHSQRYWNEHNFVFKEDDLFYHAKGATLMKASFMPDVAGPQIIPLNMAQPILLVQGVEAENNLGFAPHGAGRNMSRMQHKNENMNETKKQIFERETRGLDVRFFFDKIDISELPSAYKNAEHVKAQIESFNLATVVDEIRPYGCIMAGDYDLPWKKKK